MTTTHDAAPTSLPRWGQQVRDGFDADALETAERERLSQGARRTDRTDDEVEAYQVLRETPTCAAAQGIVDALAEEGFPVETTRVVSVGLRRVEGAAGLTTARAAWRGAVNGATSGLFPGAVIGVLMGSWTAFAVVLGLWVLGGLAWGALLGTVAHALAGGRPASTTRTVMEAGAYQVQVESAYVAQARDALRR